MHEVTLFSNSLPLIREIGHMWDDEGTSGHPDRLMENIHVFVYVKKGTIQVIEDEVEYQLNGGSYLFLRKNVPHWGNTLYSPGTEWYYIHFYDSLQQENMDETSEYSHYQQSSLILEATYHSHIKLPKQGKVLNPEYTELHLKKLNEDYMSPHPIRPLYLSVMTYQFFIDLYANRLEESKKTKQHRIVGKMIELFSNTASKKLSSKEIASMLGMNYAYLSTLFKKETGKSITQFQDELLIEKAITKLKKESVNISEVSNALGFSNPFYFSRVFKKVTGVSPTIYLNQTYRN
ncbi:helix-turn-helix domain-containing protein [Metabacillus bambusae]|uniref:Helix-turn-helix transcriptional regulator n=1 Tax=Metabacillus bambusae TaxID=2795218 RepID=A0ABS3MWF8_9BACI|nr:AraC family transcriptional regulator [Metabacillus bambusae]MBO1510230.1 helix-turn-helix transcriptional regulator [Metabacillus bambusae]